MVVYSAYLKPGHNRQLDEGNVWILRHIGCHMKAHSRLRLLGADFNAAPNAVTDSGFLEEVGLEAMVLDQALAIFVGGGCVSTIDVFLGDAALLSGAKEVAALTDAAEVKQHRPVRLIFHPLWCPRGL